MPEHFRGFLKKVAETFQAKEVLPSSLYSELHTSKQKIEQLLENLTPEESAKVYGKIGAWDYAVALIPLVCELTDACERYLKNPQARQTMRIAPAYTRFTKACLATPVRELPTLIEGLLQELQTIEDLDSSVRKNKK